MGCNYYKSVPEFRDYLKTQITSDSDIPKDVFMSYMMIFFGFSKDAGRRWFDDFESVGLIRVSRSAGVDGFLGWVVNFV